MSASLKPAGGADSRLQPRAPLPSGPCRRSPGCLHRRSSSGIGFLNQFGLGLGLLDVAHDFGDIDRCRQALILFGGWRFFRNLFDGRKQIIDGRALRTASECPGRPLLHHRRGSSAGWGSSAVVDRQMVRPRLPLDRMKLRARDLCGDILIGVEIEFQPLIGRLGTVFLLFEAGLFHLDETAFGEIETVAFSSGWGTGSGSGTGTGSASASACSPSRRYRPDRQPLPLVRVLQAP